MKKKLLNLMNRRSYKPMTFRQLAKKLRIRKTKEIERLSSVLNSMEDEGKMIRTHRARYALLEQQGRITGIIQSHPHGYAFLLPDDPREVDVFISPDNLKGAMHEDRVIVRVIERARDGRRREGKIERIIERRHNVIMGSYKKLNDRHGFVVANDKRIIKDIFIPYEKSKEAKDKDKVLVKITRWPNKDNSLEGEIIEIIGSPEMPGIDILTILKKYELPEDFPLKVKKELTAMTCDLDKRELHNRRDLRNIPMVTIDDDDAKDLDDAVSLQIIENGSYRLGVHIADVSYYVKEGSALDKEAFNRGTSVYLTDRVIPMLPSKLSNDLCSLDPQKDRFAVSVFMILNQNGELDHYEFYPSVINTNARMTYHDIGLIVEEKDPYLRQKYESLVAMFEQMSELAKILQRRRRQRGALDFKLPETKVYLDQQGVPIKVEEKKLGLPQSIIEEFMLLCNEVIARHFYRSNIPFLYRIHEKPDEGKMLLFRDFIALFNILLKVPPEGIRPKYLQQILNKVENTKAERVVNYVLLRSMPQARYSAILDEHFGLASKCYTHFTSPIRRYPDLVIHRILHEYIEGKLTPERVNKLVKDLPHIALQASERERVAMEAERESVEIKKIQYMKGQEGRIFEGIINGVTSFGLFVELDNTIEGLIHISKLEDDYYIFHEKQYALIGERTGRIFRLGDSVKVRVDNVNQDEVAIDFSLVEYKKINNRTY